MRIALIEQSGAARGYSAADDVLHGPGWSVDLSVIADGEFVEVGGFPYLVSRARRQGGVLHCDLVFDGPGQIWDTSTLSQIGDGAAGGDFLTLSPTTVAVALSNWRSTASMVRADFAQACAEAGLITWPEGIAWASAQSLPAIAETLVSSRPEAERDPLRLKLLTTARVSRNAPEVLALQAMLALSDAQVDALFPTIED